ncbi:MAG: Nif3-like dinuclear metal center hexameric protein [Peptococcaceae bacterium]|nr:Nif3-like dinuclear metal center hexameric protein [Peptococcaceae bacterium]
MDDISVSIEQITQIIEHYAPKSWAETWDNVGLLVGNGAAKVQRILLTLDGTIAVAQEAAAKKAELIVAHHPLIFEPLKNLRADNPGAATPIYLLRHDIAYYAAHTNLDQSVHSSSWTIAEELSLQDAEFLAPAGQEGYVKIVVYVPPEAEEDVRHALVEAGVGTYSGGYEECFFAGAGIGMFRPLPGAHPAIGVVGVLTRTAEIRLESIVPERAVRRAVRALRRAHPYEEPAFDLIPLNNEGQQRGYGVIGRLSSPQTLEQWIETLLALPCFQGRLTRPALRLAGDPRQTVRKIAIINGRGGSFLRQAIFKGADVLITGDADHHTALDALASGVALLDIGHYYSEFPMLQRFEEMLRRDPALSRTEILLSDNPTEPFCRV